MHSQLQPITNVTSTRMHLLKLNGLDLLIGPNEVQTPWVDIVVYISTYQANRIALPVGEPIQDGGPAPQLDIAVLYRDLDDLQAPAKWCLTDAFLELHEMALIAGRLLDLQEDFLCGRLIRSTADVIRQYTALGVVPP